MKCPVDGNPMSGGQQGVMRYEACPHCRGLWLSAETLAAPNPPVFVLFKNLPGLDPVEVPDDTIKQCDDCRRALVAREVNGTTIDVCPRCRMIWLGVGEFDRVATWYRSHERHEWPVPSELEAVRLPDSASRRDGSGLPTGIVATAGTAFTEPPRDEAPADRMKRAIRLLGDLVDRNMTE